MTRGLASFVGMALMLAATRAGAQLPEVREGDVVFQTSRSAQSEVIAEVTGSRWTHVGIVLRRGGALEVLHASGTVHGTPWPAWASAGVEGRVLVMRPVEALRDAQLAALRRAAAQFEGVAYDARFAWGDERLYCSELVYRVYEQALGVRLVLPQAWRDLVLTPRARALARRRLGGMPPPDGRLVTPDALARSPLLTAR